MLAARALQRSVRVVLTRQQMYALGYRPAMIQRIALGATPGRARRDHASRTHRDVAIRGLPSARDWLVRVLSTNAPMPITRISSRGSIFATSCDMRARALRRAVYALESAMDELAVALKLDPLELRLRCYSDRDQHEDQPFSSKALRECYRQGAEAFGWDKRNPEPRSMRDGSDLVGWGMATGIWDALQSAHHRAHRAQRQRPCRSRMRDLRHRHRHLHDHGAGCGGHAGAAAREHQHQAWRLEPSAIAGRGRLVDCGLGVKRDCDDGRYAIRDEL